jgi:hypothetical protein
VRHSSEAKLPPCKSVPKPSAWHKHEPQFEKDWRLFLAAKGGDLKTGREALSAGANPNFVEPPNHKRPSQKPCSTLLRAVGFGQVAFAEMLLDAGASIPETKSEQVRLSYAARCARSPATLLLLLRRGLPPSCEDADWAQEYGFREIQELVEQVLGPFTIVYDIDELLTTPYNKFYYKFCSAVPSYSSIHDPMLYPQERVIRDLWEFACDTGSGLTTFISNEHYDTLVRTYQALYEIRPSICLRAVSELREVLRKNGFPPEPDKAFKHRCALSEAAEQAMENEIEALDRRFFTYKTEQSLWGNPDYLDYGMDYARNHIEILRKRKHQR